MVSQGNGGNRVAEVLVSRCRFKENLTNGIEIVNPHRKVIEVSYSKVVEN